MSSVTTLAAKTIGMDHRIGSVREGQSRSVSPFRHASPSLIAFCFHLRGVGYDAGAYI